MNLRGAFPRARFWASVIVGLAYVLALFYRRPLPIFGWSSSLRGGACSQPLHCAISASPRRTLMMPRDGAIIFRDIVGKLTVLRITCD